MKYYITLASVAGGLAFSIPSAGWGQNGFGDQQVLSSSLSGPDDIIVADMDNDGNSDLAVALRNENKVVWF